MAESTTMAKQSTPVSKKRHRESSEKVPLEKSGESKAKDDADRAPREAWSKSKKKRMRRIKAKNQYAEHKKSDDSGDDASPSLKEAPEESPPVKASKDQSASDKSSALRESFKSRLSGSRFRILNEELYTTTSASAFDRFKKNPELFDQYHEGFRSQVEKWPVNPIDVIVRSLKTLVGKQENKNKKNNKLVVADFGCGDAALAKQLLMIRPNGKCPFEVHSFDLVAPNELVTACDMANVPLQDATVDMGIFCLSLMGTNLADFVRECHRVLKPNGQVKIAEVRSRFEGKSGKDELTHFCKILDQLGFECVKTDRSNKMFVLLDLRKNGKTPNTELAFTAKPCIYKRR